MQWVKFLFLFVVLVSVGWAAWLLYTGQYGQFAVAFFAALLMGGVYMFLLRPYVHLDALMTRLNTQGRPVQASVVSVKQTSSYVNELPVMLVKVSYVVEGKPVTSEVKQPLPYQALSHVQPGKRVHVLVDPKNSSQFVLKP